MTLAHEAPNIGHEGRFTFIAGRLHQVSMSDPLPIDLAHGTRPLGTDGAEWFDLRHGMVLGYQEAGVAATPCALPPLHRLHSLGPTRLYSRRPQKLQASLGSERASTTQRLQDGLETGAATSRRSIAASPSAQPGYRVKYTPGCASRDPKPPPQCR